MRIINKFVIASALILLSTSVVSAQNLSKYRSFSLGMRLAEISKQVNATSDDVTATGQNPALIQQLTWQPKESNDSSARSEAIEQIQFSFFNRELYRIAAMYDETATKGLTADDMVQAVSALYGVASRPPAATDASAHFGYSGTDTQLAFWEDSQYSVTLSHPPFSNSFQLVILSKPVNAQAEAEIAEAAKQEHEDAPQREAARTKKEADDLEIVREANLKAFRP